MDNLNNTSGTFFDWNLFRRDVRRDVRDCALFLFFFYAIYALAAIITMVVVMASGEAFQNLLSGQGGLADLYSSGGLSGEGLAGAGEDLTDAVTDIMGDVAGPMSIVGIIAGSCVFFILRKRRFITDLAKPAFETMTPKIFIILIMATQAIQLVYSLIVALIDQLLPKGTSLLENYGTAMESLITPVGIVYIVLVGPIFEELIFRGAVLGTLRKYGDNFAILFSSILFGFYHAIFLQIPFGFVMGLLFGYVACRWSLRPAIVLHIIVNGLSVLLTVTNNEGFTTAGGIAMIACTILTVIFAIICRKTLVMRVRAGAAYYPRTYRNGFSSIAFWLFIISMAVFGLVQMLAL